MWSADIEKLTEDRGLKVAVKLDGSAVSYADVIQRWQRDAEFRLWFVALLADAPYRAFRWETPPVTTTTVIRPFEFVVLDSPGLAQKPDAAAFAEHFQNAKGEEVIEFANLGKDAIMIVPCPSGPHSPYGHLAAFVREAPMTQQHALWELVGAAMARRLSAVPVWLSTAGAGVSWLHVRLDNRPKYYGYGPYRQEPGGTRVSR